MRHSQAGTAVGLSALVVFGASAAGFAKAPKASFRYNEMQVVPKDVFALQVTPAESDGPVTVVAFADFAFDRKQIKEAITTRVSLLRQADDNKGNVVIILVDGEKCDVSAYLSKTSQHLGLGSDFPGTVTSQGKTHVIGDCGTESPGKIFDDTYEFSLPFDVDLTKIPEPKELGPGGGAPGIAVKTLVAAIQTKDWATAKKHLLEEDAQATTPRHIELTLQGLALNYPRQVTVTHGVIKGHRALVDVKGIDKDGKKIKGTYEMVKTGGQWRVENHSLLFDFD